MIPPAHLKGSKRLVVFKDPNFPTVDTLRRERSRPAALVIALVPIFLP